ncbi:MAG: hypothetical protein JNM90_10935, partial [Burkholderiales bacterium]|nr:hypothetical protein [Burkholderiales bacterium]
RLKVTGSHFHNANVGHLLKSRAAESHIRYNRLGDGGKASYELEFPNGGVAVVVGNIIQQGRETENPVMVSFGAEGYPWPVNALYLTHNTMIDNLESGGVPLWVAPGSRKVFAANNVVVGTLRLEAAGDGTFIDNPTAERGDFVNAEAGDFRPRAGSRLDVPARWLDQDAALSLRPRREYRAPRGTRVLTGQSPRQGAMQGRE